MQTKSHTERMDCLFRVAEDGLGVPFIYMEPRHGGMKFFIKTKPNADSGETLLKVSASFFFGLPTSTTLQQAENASQFLNENLEMFYCTTSWQEDDDGLGEDLEQKSPKPAVQ